MTREEAAGLLIRLTAAFPGFDMPEATAVIWLEYLGRYHHGDGVTACIAAESSLDHFPSLARFLDLCNKAAGRRRGEQRALEAGDPAITPEAAKENIGRLRGALSGIGRRVDDPDADGRGARPTKSSPGSTWTSSRSAG